MLNKIEKYLSNVLAQDFFYRDDELKLHLMSLCANAFALLIHVYLLLVFLFAGRQYPLFLGFNAFSCIFYVAIYFLLLRKRRYAMFGLLLSCEVLLYTTVFALVTGLETNIVGYYMLILVLQVTVPYGTSKMRTGIIAAVGICAMVSIIASLSMPQLTFVQPLYNILLVSNICVMLIGTTMELYIGRMTQYTIDKLHRGEVDRLSSEADTDPLTGTYNRRYAKRFFLAPESEQRDACVALLDIDDFKQVNDTYGHASGDEVLIFLANYLRSRLRKTDVVFRWGGEEFLLILRDVQLKEAVALLDSLRVGISEEVIDAQGNQLSIRVTIGVVALDWDDVDGSIDKSDKLMYAGKRNGKNQVVSGEEDIQK